MSAGIFKNTLVPVRGGACSVYTGGGGTMKTLNTWLNDEGKVSVYPTGGEAQHVILVYLASKFEENRLYKEAQVNDIISAWHTFDNLSRLRQDMLTSGLLTMKPDGSHYWKVRQEDKPTGG